MLTTAGSVKQQQTVARTALQPSPASVIHENPQQGQGSSKRAMSAAHTPNATQLSYHTEAQPLQDTSNLPQSQTGSVTSPLDPQQQYGLTLQPMPLQGGTDHQAQPRHQQGDTQHQHHQQKHIFGQEPGLWHGSWQPAATDGTLHQSNAAQLMHGMSGGHSDNQLESLLEDQFGQDRLEPTWPESRNLEEEQQADAAEARLLSIVAQLKSAQKAGPSQSQSAEQASCACHHNDLPELSAAWKHEQ